MYVMQTLFPCAARKIWYSKYVSIRVSTEQEKFLREAAKIFTKLPPLKDEGIVKPEKEQCVCGKTVDISQFDMLNTGLFLTHSNVCKGCKEGHAADKSHARVVCVNCKRVFTHIKPGVDKTGFKIEAGKSYHMKGCPRCQSLASKNTAFPLIEKVVWNRAHGINTGENSNATL